MNRHRDVDLDDCLKTGDWLIDMMNEPRDDSEVDAAFQAQPEGIGDRGAE